MRGATFGLALAYASGRPALVPAWLFDTAPAGTVRTLVVAQTAVAPAYLRPASGAAITPVPPAPLPPARGIPATPQTRGHAPVAGYRTSGTTLTITFMSGPCTDFRVSARETSGQVRVTVLERPHDPGAPCTMPLVAFDRTLVLDRPLGSRTVVDTDSGRAVPQR